MEATLALDDYDEASDDFEAHIDAEEVVGDLQLLNTAGDVVSELRLRVGENKIGRSESDVRCCIEGNPTVSSLHCQIDIAAQPSTVSPASLLNPFFTPHHTLLDLDAVFLTDLGSSNHTHLGSTAFSPTIASNPRPLRVIPHKPRLLRHDQHIFMGTQVCRFKLWKYEEGVRLARKLLSRRPSADSRAQTQVVQGGGAGDTQLMVGGDEGEMENGMEPGAPPRGPSPVFGQSDEVGYADAEEREGSTANVGFEAGGFGDFQTLQSDDFDEEAPGTASTTAMEEQREAAPHAAADAQSRGEGQAVDAEGGGSRVDAAPGSAVLSADSDSGSGAFDSPLEMTLPPGSHPEAGGGVNGASLSFGDTGAAGDVEPSSLISPNATQPLFDSDNDRIIPAVAPSLSTGAVQESRKASARTRRAAPLAPTAKNAAAEMEEEKKRRAEEEARQLEEERRAAEEAAANYRDQQAQRARLREEQRKRDEEEQLRLAEEQRLKREALEKERAAAVEASKQERLRQLEKERLEAQQRRRERELQEQREDEEERARVAALAAEKEAEAALRRQEEEQRRREAELKAKEEEEQRRMEAAAVEEAAAKEAARLAAEKKRSDSAAAQQLQWRDKKSKKGVNAPHSDNESPPPTPPKASPKRKRQKAEVSAEKPGKRGARRKTKAEEITPTPPSGVVEVLSVQEESMDVDDVPIPTSVVERRSSRAAAATASAQPRSRDDHPRQSLRSRSAGHGDAEMGVDEVVEVQPAKTAQSTGAASTQRAERQDSLRSIIRKQEEDDDSKRASAPRRGRSALHLGAAPSEEQKVQEASDPVSAVSAIAADDELELAVEERRQPLEAPTPTMVPNDETEAKDNPAVLQNVSTTQPIDQGESGERVEVTGYAEDTTAPMAIEDTQKVPSFSSTSPPEGVGLQLRSAQTQEVLSVLEDMNEAQALTASPAKALALEPIQEAAEPQRGRKRKATAKALSTPAPLASSSADVSSISDASPPTKRSRSRAAAARSSSSAESTASDAVSSSPPATPVRGSRRSQHEKASAAVSPSSASSSFSAAATQPITPTSRASSSPTSSTHTTRRAISTSPCLLFTAVDPTIYLPAIERLGGSITTHPSEASHLVTNNVRRTDKFMAAYNSVQHIVSTRWLDASTKAGQWVNPELYALVDDEAEEKWGFSLKARHVHALPLKGWRVWPTPHVQPGREALQLMVEAAGGRVMEQAPEGGETKVIVVGCEEDRGECEQLTKKAFTVYTKEAVLCGILRQDFEPLHSEFVLFSPQRAVGGGRGRGRGKTR